MRYSLSPSDFRGHAFVTGMKILGVLTKPFGNKGLFRAGKIFGKYLSPDQTCTIFWDSDKAFTFGLSDHYWLRCVTNSYSYEPEINHLLVYLKETPIAFLDCGANFGYWSVVASSAMGGAKQTIAVEAAPENFARLRNNAAQNEERFETLHFALFDQADTTVSFNYDPLAHAASGIKEASKDTIEVNTITLDQLAQKVTDPELLIVVKLDVEGAEQISMRAASALKDRDFLIIYEDHGNEPDSETTDFFLNDQKLSVYFIHENGTVEHVKSAKDASRLKKSPHVGYNFIACPEEGTTKKILGAKLEKA